MPTRVVIVRVDRPAHALIAAAFEMAGCEVYCASDPRAAWTLIVQKRPHVLLIEYPEQMDGGLKLLQRARVLREHGAVVAAAVSNALSAQGTATIASDADLCYRMPKSPADIVHAILRHAAGTGRSEVPPESAEGVAEAPAEPRSDADPSATS